jgi:AbrB family looped-hinge helix DNA binding protein
LKKQEIPGKPPAGKKFYGSITVSSRGQIVIPSEARTDFNIKNGDKLLVFGDMKTGLWICTADIISSVAEGSLAFLLGSDAEKQHGKKENRDE